MGAGRILAGVIAVLLLFGVVAGVGWTAYNAGMAQGMVTSGNVTPPALNGQNVPVVPFYAPYVFHRPFGFGFGLFGCLVPLFFLFVIFMLFRIAIFGPRWRRRWWGGPGMYGHGDWDPSKGDVPPPVKEWHRKLHEQETTNSSQPR